MKKIVYFLIALFLVQSCAKDNSSEIFPKDNPNFSMITITSDVSTLSVDYGKEFVFTPKVTQGVEAKNLQYIWTANPYNVQSEVIGEQFSCGEGSTLKYTFKKIGTYKLRLEVKNEDYSEFKVWDLTVRAYDKGFFVVGNDEQGNTDIAFGRTLSESEILEGKQFKFESNVFGTLNPEIKITNCLRITKAMLSNDTDAASFIYIYTPDKIYAADPNTLAIFMTTSLSDQYPDERILKVSSGDVPDPGVSLFTSKNRVLTYSKSDFIIYMMDKYKSLAYDDITPNIIITSGKNSYSLEIGIDYTNSKIWGMVSTNHGIVSNTGRFDMNLWENVDDVKPNVFKGYNLLGVSRFNGDAPSATPREFVVIAQKKDDVNAMKLVTIGPENSANMGVISETDYKITAPLTYQKGSPLIPNARYNSFYYANGSEVYIWYPKNSVPNNQLPTTSAINLGAGKEITTMCLSFDMKQLYVGFYDKNSTNALKGGFYIYNAGEIGTNLSIQPVNKYENITTRPVQILYKSNQYDQFTSSDTK